MGKVWTKSVQAAVCLIKHETEKGDPRSFYMQTILLASTCCSLKTLQPLAAWLQMAYGQHMRVSSSGLLRSWLSINTLIFLWACMKCMSIINIYKGTNTLMYVHICHVYDHRKGCTEYASVKQNNQIYRMNFTTVYVIAF